MNPKQIFEKGLFYHHYANTAYPLTPSSFKAFRLDASASIESFLRSEWGKADALSLYVHIPFCSVRCKFCEYTVLEHSDATIENEYVDLLLKEIALYAAIVKDAKIVGYDMGGGTPTKLSIDNLQRITDSIQASFAIADQTTFSIETTPVIAAKDKAKLFAAFNMGYKRISMGVQTVSDKLLNELGREGSTQVYERAVKNIRDVGYKKLNIDLMYGFLYQNDIEFENTLRYAIALNPEYITLYRNRYKGTKLESEAGGVSLYKIISQYRLAYKVLNQNGYKANVGKNTFSKVKDDYGTSDYLTKRVVEGMPYIGMGLGSQSLGMDYLAYNAGAASKKLAAYKKKLLKNELPIQDIYALPKDESIAKMVSVAFYFGFIDFNAFERRFGIDFKSKFKEEIAFLTSQKLMIADTERLYLTDRGSDYINGIIPLFYSIRSQQELLSLIHKNRTLQNGEEAFLKAYNIEEFQRPSLTVDIVTVTEKGHSLLLIKRGEHPFMNLWALPGGFVKPGESVEQSARRELQEETGLTEIALSQLQVFSDSKRDPRGWIISCAFWGTVKTKVNPLQFGEDAIDAQWFDVNMKKSALETGDLIYELELKSGATTLQTKIQLPQNASIDQATVLESRGIAFDHGKIVFCALQKIFKSGN